MEIHYYMNKFFSKYNSQTGNSRDEIVLFFESVHPTYLQRLQKYVQKKISSG